MSTSPTSASASAAGIETCAYCGAKVEPVRVAHHDARAQRPHLPRAVCPRCGALRVARGASSSAAGSRSASSATDTATVALTSASVWRDLALSALAFAIFSALVVWLVMSVADPPEVANVVALAGALAPLGFAGYAFTRWQTRAREVPGAVERAWQAAVLKLAGDRQSLDAPALAAATHLTAAEAEPLLVELTRSGKLVLADPAHGSPRYTLASGAKPAH